MSLWHKQFAGCFQREQQRSRRVCCDQVSSAQLAPFSKPSPAESCRRSIFSVLCRNGDGHIAKRILTVRNSFALMTASNSRRADSDPAWRSRKTRPKRVVSSHQSKRGSCGIASLVHAPSLLCGRQMISRAGPPHIERRQQEGAHDQVNDQAANDNDRKRPLRVRTDGVRRCRRQQAQRCDQHGHHNWPQPPHRALYGRLLDRTAPCA